MSKAYDLREKIERMTVLFLAGTDLKGEGEEEGGWGGEKEKVAYRVGIPSFLFHVKTLELS